MAAMMPTTYSFPPQTCIRYHRLPAVHVLPAGWPQVLASPSVWLNVAPAGSLVWPLAHAVPYAYAHSASTLSTAPVVPVPRPVVLQTVQPMMAVLGGRQTAGPQIVLSVPVARQATFPAVHRSQVLLHKTIQIRSVAGTQRVEPVPLDVFGGTLRSTCSISCARQNYFCSAHANPKVDELADSDASTCSGDASPSSCTNESLELWEATGQEDEHKLKEQQQLQQEEEEEEEPRSFRWQRSCL